jgi:hypothetical protein
MSEGAMRRWHFLNWLLRETQPRDWDRCILVVEQLETREVLSPVVFFNPAPPPAPQTNANVAYTFNSDTGAFFVSDFGNFGQTYQAVLTATHGTISVDAAFAIQSGVTVSNNGTSSVTLTGPLDGQFYGPPAGINNVLQNVETFSPAPFYNGDALIGLTVTDLQTEGNPSGSGSVDLHVLPVASSPAFAVNAPTEFPAPSSGFVFPPGTVTVAQWPEPNGTVTVTFTLSVSNPDQYTLSANGVPITQLSMGIWQVSGTSAAALQATLDSLVFTPPPGFTGRVDLSVGANLTDQVTFADGTSASSSQILGFGDLPIRFYLGGSITAQNASGTEGSAPVDLSGHYSVSDPDVLPGDTLTLTLSVPQGALTPNTAAVPAGLSVTNGGSTLALTGTVDEINTFLATPGSLTYTGDPRFAGIVTIALVLTLQPGPPPPPSEQMPQAAASDPVAGPPPVVASAQIDVAPVADPVFPSATDVTTTVNTPVALSITLSGLSSLDSAESAAVVLNGVPAGASFNHGTDLGNGQWAFSPSDLTGLTFTPPHNATGAFALTVTVVVTDSVPGLAANTASESTTFTVTVTAPAPTPVVTQLPPAPIPPQFEAPESNVTPGPIGGPDPTTAATGRPASATPVPGQGLVNAYSSGSTVSAQIYENEQRVSTAPPAPGSLFTQVEAPLPSYVLGERHPLPPVLPLDQTLPVAGFTESGGDSLALVDKLYREAAGIVPPATTISRAPVESAPAAETNTNAERVTQILLGVAPPRTGETGAPSAPSAPDAAEEAGGEWRVWTAAAAIAGSLAAWAWLSRGPNGLLARTVRRFLRDAHRRSAQVG